MARPLSYPPCHPPGSVPVAGSPAFFLDYDGTLAPIHPDPARALPHPDAPGVLRGLLVTGAPLYVVTGRRVRDLGPLLGVEGLRVFGVHGMEEAETGAGGAVAEVRSLVPAAALGALEAVRRRLPAVAGLRVEDKGSAIALHYRGAPSEEAVVEALEAWARDLPGGLEVLWGKKVLEVRVAGFGKGKAVAGLARRHPGRTPVCLGDDRTDEEAFEELEAVGRELGLEPITVKVGEGPTRARYRLTGVEEAVAYLRGYLG